MDDELIARIAALTRRAQTTATGPEAAAALAAVTERLEDPVRLAISGKVKAGKSTLLNALIGENLAPTDAGEYTRVVTWYRYSARPYATVFPTGEQPRETTYVRGEESLVVDLGGLDADQVERLEIGWPTRRLEDLVLIDTPGIASIRTEVSERTHRVLSAEGGRVPVADAVLYLLRHAHGTDLRFLEAFHDDEVGHGTSVNSVGVLSRADEIGSARLDAMDVAERVALRYRADRRLHRLCPIVVPVNGLLGHAAATLREDEYAAIAALARERPEVVGELLLTADRFATRESGPVPVDRRSKLLDRLGLYGVRLAVELARTGAVSSSTELSHRLAEVCGLDRLREVVAHQFAARSRVLKAQSAVAALRESFRRGDCADGPVLLHELEQIAAGAHEFEEIRILLELREGGLSLDAERAAQLDRLMGGSGHEPSARLGLSADASGDVLAQAATAALATWQGVASHPLSTRTTQIAARAAVRTLEGLLSR